MIPKTIHYCWFGKNKKPKLIKKCIKSWKKYCPDYQIIEWNEDNFDINYNEYVKEAYRLKKWAFVSDVARIYALVKCGGVYLDTDMELIKPIDYYLSLKAFCGREDLSCVGTAILGCEKNFPLFKDLLLEYEKENFTANQNGLYRTITDRLTMFVQRNGEYLIAQDVMQNIDELTVYPIHYFYPKDMSTGILDKIENSYAIHHGCNSFLSSKDRLRIKLFKFFNRVFGKKFSSFLYKILGRGRQ